MLSSTLSCGETSLASPSSRSLSCSSFSSRVVTSSASTTCNLTPSIPLKRRWRLMLLVLLPLAGSYRSLLRRSRCTPSSSRPSSSCSFSTRSTQGSLERRSTTSSPHSSTTTCSLLSSSSPLPSRLLSFNTVAATCVLCPSLGSRTDTAALLVHSLSSGASSSSSSLQDGSHGSASRRRRCPPRRSRSVLWLLCARAIPSVPRRCKHQVAASELAPRR